MEKNISQNEPWADACGSPTVSDGTEHPAYTINATPVTKTIPYSFHQSQDGSACGVNVVPDQGNSTITSTTEGTKTSFYDFDKESPPDDILRTSKDHYYRNVIVFVVLLTVACVCIGFWIAGKI